MMRRFMPYLLVLLFFIALHGALVATGISPYLKGQLGDSDSYMRLLRVEALVSDLHSWFDSSVPRMNAPLGDNLNWTRPLDVLILAGALPLVAYADFTWHDAIYQAGSWLPPLLQILMAFALAWAAAPLLQPAQRPLVMLLSALLPVMIAYNMAGRPDQQTLLLIATIMMLGWATRGLMGQELALRAGLYAGLWAGFGLWVTVEAQFAYLALCGMIGLVWLERGKDELLDLLEGLALGFFIMVSIGMLAERGAAWQSIRELDKISLTHALFAVVNVAFCGFLATSARHAHAMGRILLTALWSGLALAGLIFFAPEMLQGPAGQIDPRVMQGFFLQIREMRPLWPLTLEDASLMLLWLGVPLVALPLWVAARPNPLLPWLPFAGVTAIFTLAALMHARFAQTAAPLACVLLVFAMAALTENLKGGKRLALRALILLTPLLTGIIALALMPEDGRAPPKCNVADIAPRLRELPEGIIMAPINYGPEILYMTGHSVIAGPYHRNTQGILDALEFFGSSSNARAQDIIKRRTARYVLSCPTMPDRPPQKRQNELAGKQANQQAGDEIPGWLAPISLPEGQDLRLYRVK